MFPRRRRSRSAFCVASGKGGVGKTTTSANVGTGLAKAAEPVVALVSADKTYMVSTSIQGGYGFSNCDVTLVDYGANSSKGFTQSA